ncbi:laccase-1 [Gaeumannomyces tritici R3-111a-1]|uniref:Laccase-1 n=1 Tax=Gaeumannomyces tritici (strain R3-111a-1) TaxID=644352 RepID=J3PI40_GAET3|nr:laccase-1 [Gaeumannomyces tritici R3-111a-1]EJT69552.1 laccase-1 [Gaeumannomyces tritici R3-111a-1]
MAFVDGQFPGPLIEANQGDNVEVVVTNGMPMNTTIHFHGITQIGTPWSDGVPGLTQRYIQPGKSFTHKWKADQYGSYWYHAHSRGQIDDGLYGPILINGKGQENCWSCTKINQLTTGIQRVFLQRDGDNQLTDKGCLPARSVAAGLSPGLQVNLSAIPADIFDNCKPTNGELAVIQVTQDPTGIVSIDEHPMYVYAVDGGYIQPQLVQAISVANGDRYSVLIKADRAGDFAIRVASAAMPQLMSGMATMRVQAANSSSPTRVVTRGDDYGDDEDGGETGGKQKLRIQQAPPVPAPTQPAVSPTSTPYINDAGAAASRNTFKLSMRHDGAAYKWALNGTIYPASADEAPTPILFGPPQTKDENDVTISTQNNTWIDLVFESAIFPMPPHPVHKHGTHMYLIGQGQGNFTWNSVAKAAPARPQSFNLQNPPKRDTFQSLVAVGQPAWIAVRYHSSDPGPWLMHCHIQAHLEGGMAMVIQDGVDAWPQVPSEYLEMS